MSSSTSTLTIITGSSRGMGEAIAKQCLDMGHAVIGIARGHSDALDELASRHGASLQQWRHDLTAPEAAGWALLEWLQAQPADRFERVVLINNACLLAPLKPLADTEPTETARALRVGLEAALVLTGLFLRGTATWTGQRRIINISSGLGRRAMAGSATYCATKAGMDHFTRAVALEEASKPNGAKLVSLAPGVIDTDMQVQMRSANPAEFPDHDRFTSLAANGQLSSPAHAARQILGWLDRPDFGANVIADVREP